MGCRGRACPCPAGCEYSVWAGLVPALPAVNIQFGQGQALPLLLPTRDKWTGLDDKDLTFHVGPFDVLVFVAKDSLDPGGRGS